MSGPTYRIDVAHDPSLPYPFCFEIFRVSDDERVGYGAASTDEQAVASAREQVAGLTARREPFSVLVDDDGNIMPDSHSVRVP